MTTEKLITLARTALDTKEDPQLQIALVEEYSDAFEVWNEGPRLKETSREKLEELEKLHGEIVTLTQSLLEAAGGEIRNLKVKAKAIFKYVDTFPHLGTGPVRRKG